MLDSSAQQYYLNAMGLPQWRLKADNKQLTISCRYIPSGILNLDSEIVLQQPVDVIEPAESKRVTKEQKLQPDIQPESVQQIPEAVLFSTVDPENLSPQLQSQQWFQLLSKEISLCSLCKARTGGEQSLKTQLLRYSQKSSKNLLLLVEMPSAREYVEGVYISDQYRSLLYSIFQAVNLDVNIYISSVIKCSSSRHSYVADKEIINQEIINCLGFLKQELNSINPDLIVTMGSIKINSLAEEIVDDPGLEKLLEQPFHLKKSLTDNKSIPILATFHPSFLYRNPLFKAKALQHWIKIATYLGSESNCVDSRLMK